MYDALAVKIVRAQSKWIATLKHVSQITSVHLFKVDMAKCRSKVAWDQSGALPPQKVTRVVIPLLLLLTVLNPELIQLFCSIKTIYFRFQNNIKCFVQNWNGGYGVEGIDIFLITFFNKRTLSVSQKICESADLLKVQVPLCHIY